MQSDNRFFDDLSRVINGAAGTIAGVGREFENTMKERTRSWMAGMDFVSREEFEAVKEMAARAREEADALKARLDALEGKAVAKARPAKSSASAKNG